jgi:hypothetical protein
MTLSLSIRRTTAIRQWAALLVLPLLLVAACDQAAESPFQPEEPSIRASYGPDPAVDVFAFADFSVVGSSQLVRTPNGVSYTLQTTGLTPGHAYTLWIVIFNDTGGCTDGTPGFALCGPADVVNDAARPDMMYAGGHVAGSSGLATFSGRRQVGDLSGSANAPVGLPAYGLEDPAGAEFNLVVHDHGSMLPDYLPDMIQSIDGGCYDAGVPAPGAASPWNDYNGGPAGAFGRRGPSTCQSVQFVVHSP